MLTWNTNICLTCGLQSCFTYYFLYLFTAYICFPFKVDFCLKKSKINCHSNLLKSQSILQYYFKSLYFYWIFGVHCGICVSIHVCLLVHICVKARGPCQMLFCIVLCLTFPAKISHWTVGHWLHRMVGQWAPRFSCLCLSVLRISVHTATSNFLHVCLRAKLRSLYVQCKYFTH